VFWEFLGFPPKRDNDFSIDLMHGITPVSKTPYKMSNTQTERIANATRRFVEEEVDTPNFFSLGCHTPFCE
jgi:hypothetical protein